MSSAEKRAVHDIAGAEKYHLPSGRIAILLAAYNGARYLEEQLESLRNQTLQDFVCFIHDDGSTDGTQKIASAWCSRHPEQFVYMGSSPTGGAKYNFLYMLRAVEADYVMFCDQDDVWLPEKIEKTRQAMRQAEEMPEQADTQPAPRQECLEQENTQPVSRQEHPEKTENRPKHAEKCSERSENHSDGHAQEWLNRVENQPDCMLVERLERSVNQSDCAQEWPEGSLKRERAGTRSDHLTDQVSPPPVCVFSDLCVVDADLQVMNPSFFAYSSINPRRTSLRQLLFNNVAPGCTMMLNAPLRRLMLAADVADQINMHDWLAMLLAAAVGKIVLIDEPLICYRQHEDNVVGASQRSSLRQKMKKLLQLKAWYEKKQAYLADWQKNAKAVLLCLEVGCRETVEAATAGASIAEGEAVGAKTGIISTDTDAAAERVNAAKREIRRYIRRLDGPFLLKLVRFYAAKWSDR